MRAEGSTVVLVVPHRLDAAAGRILLDLAASALVGDTTEVEIDLEAVESFTEEGARALAACRTLGSRLPKGLRYRARSPGGRRLLMAMADADRGC